MSDTSIALVPKIKDVPDRIRKAENILHWLSNRDIIKTDRTDCILGLGKGYALSGGAKEIVIYPFELPVNLLTNGLEVITKETFFDPGQNYDEESNPEIPVSNLGFVFWNWPEFKPEFISEFETMLGLEIQIIYSRI